MFFYPGELNIFLFNKVMYVSVRTVMLIHKESEKEIKWLTRVIPPIYFNDEEEERRSTCYLVVNSSTV